MNHIEKRMVKKNFLSKTHYAVAEMLVPSTIGKDVVGITKKHMVSGEPATGFIEEVGRTGILQDGASFACDLEEDPASIFRYKYVGGTPNAPIVRRFADLKFSWPVLRS